MAAFGKAIHTGLPMGYGGILLWQGSDFHPCNPGWLCRGILWYRIRTPNQKPGSRAKKDKGQVVSKTSALWYEWGGWYGVARFLISKKTFGSESVFLKSLNYQKLNTLKQNRTSSKYFPNIRNIRCGPLRPLLNLRLAILLCLQGDFGRLVIVLATVCSTWTLVNIGTSKRSILVPRGDISLLCNRRGNKMTCRTGFPKTSFKVSVWNLSTDDGSICLY